MLMRSTEYHRSPEPRTEWRGVWLSRLAAAIAVGVLGVGQIACSPAPDAVVEIGPDGGGASCGLNVSRGALSTTVTVGAKVYWDQSPADMALDTAPVVPDPSQIVSWGCSHDPVAMPLVAGASVSIGPPLAVGSEYWRRAGEALFSDGRDYASFLYVLYRAEPFGAWQPESIVGDGGIAVPGTYGYAALKRGDIGVEHTYYGPGFVSRLGYSFVAAGLYFSPNLPATLRIDEGAPIPFTLGLGGTLAPGAPVRLSWTDGDYLDAVRYRSLPPGAPLSGELPFDPAWRGLTEVEITIRADYAGTLRSDIPGGSASAFYSRPMKVTIDAAAPRIDAQPANVTVDEGLTATFSVAASGSRPISYQWQRDGLDIVGATAASYTTPATTAADNGSQFAVVVTNPRGVTSSAAATLTVVPAPATVQIVRNPQLLTVTAGEPASFDVVATGAAPLAYQWLRDGTAIGGATASSQTLSTTSLGDDGSLFSVRVSNAAMPAGVTSSAARLTVLDSICPVPPLPALDTSAPPVTTGPSANYNVNLLNDPGFENTVRVGAVPDGFAYWRADQAASVAAQQGIAPRTAAGGSRMLQFVGAGPSDTVRGGASEQLQLIDVSALATAIDANGVRAEASAWFSRVAGCVQTDDAMGVQLMAFDGPPTNFRTRFSNGINAAIAQGVSRDDADVATANAWLRHRTGRFNHNSPGDKQGAIYGWRQATATMDLPAGTRFLAIVVFAFENRTDDNVFPELHGHYADDAAVVLSPR